MPEDDKLIGKIFGSQGPEIERESWKNMIDVFAKDILDRYDTDPEVNAKLEKIQYNLSRYNTLEDIQPFLENRSMLESTPEVYLGLARKWQALRKES